MRVRRPVILERRRYGAAFLFNRRFRRVPTAYAGPVSRGVAQHELFECYATWSQGFTSTVYDVPMAQDRELRDIERATAIPIPK